MHRRHWYAYEIGCVPDHEPGSAVNVWPTCAVPEMVGAAVLLGATGAAATTAVCADETVVEPTLFDAVTATRNVEPTSTELTM